MDAAPVLEACEQVLDPVALAIEDRIIAVPDPMLGMGWNAGGDAALDERLAEGGGTVGSVGQQGVGGRQVFDHCGSGLVIIGLPLAQMQQQRASLAIADHLQLAGRTGADGSGGCRKALLCGRHDATLASSGAKCAKAGAWRLWWGQLFCTRRDIIDQPIGTCRFSFALGVGARGHAVELEPANGLTLRCYLDAPRLEVISQGIE